MYLNFPPPANWQDFQILTFHLVCQTCDHNLVIEYGRQGQSQNGVDVYGPMFDGTHLGVQCKEMQSGKRLTKKMIEKEANLAKSFKLKLDQFILATTLPNDTKVHQYITELNQSGNYQFTIGSWSWDRYLASLNGSTELVKSAYSAYANNFGYDQIENYLSALSQGFGRPAFIDDFQHELDAQDFISALSDLALFLRSGNLRDRWSGQFLVKTYNLNSLPKGPIKSLATALLNDVEDIRKVAVKEHKRNELDYKKATFYNQRRQAIIIRLNAELTKYSIPNLIVRY